MYAIRSYYVRPGELCPLITLMIFHLDTSVSYRAAWSGDTLVLALSGALQGVDVPPGRT